jgi:hypothetical protein
MSRSWGEGTIVERADGRWAASLQVGGKRHWLYGKSRRDVADKLKALQQQQVHSRRTAAALEIGRPLNPVGNLGC